MTGMQTGASYVPTQCQADRVSTVSRSIAQWGSGAASFRSPYYQSQASTQALRARICEDQAG